VHRGDRRGLEVAEMDGIGDRTARYEFARATWPARSDQLHMIHEKVTAWADTSELTLMQRKGLAAAALEAVDNAVAHAHCRDERDMIELTYWTERDAVYLEITDHGIHHEFECISDDSHRRIARMQGCVDAVLIRHNRQAGTVTLRQHVPPPRHTPVTHRRQHEYALPAPRAPLPAETSTTQHSPPSARVPATAVPHHPS
jgi:anti-sigma regulatory factor (Ser/Thr protein kinase)